MRDGGQFMLRLRDDPAAYEEFLSSHDPGWGGVLPQPAERSVDHLCTLLLRLLKGSKDAADLPIEAKEVSAFRKRGGGGMEAKAADGGDGGGEVSRSRSPGPPKKGKSQRNLSMAAVEVAVLATISPR